MAFMFDEIRYELNGVDIDRNGNEELPVSSRTVSMTYYKALIALNTG